MLTGRALRCSLLLLLLSGGCGGRRAPASASGGAAAVGGAGGTSTQAGTGAGGNATAAGMGGSATAGGGDAGAAMADAGAATVELSPWPGPAEVLALDQPEQFGGNLSGLTYQAPEGDQIAALWAVSNIPGKLYRLVRNQSGYVVDLDAGWPSEGTLLRYPGGVGEADAEGVTLGETAAAGLYVVAEHDNDNAATSRLSVLRYDVAAPAAELTAADEWDVTALLPPFEANLGLEAITWIPDRYLIEGGFIDEAVQGPYAPADYPEHGAGLFFVGVEQTGMLYGLLLDHEGGSATLLASISTRYIGVMGLEHDRDVGQLWVWCDEACGNQGSVFALDDHPDSETFGRFTERHWLERPSGLPNTNNEGIAIAPESSCSGGTKPFFWTDDNDSSGQSIREGAVRCGAAL